LGTRIPSFEFLFECLPNFFRLHDGCGRSRSRSRRRRADDGELPDRKDERLAGCPEDPGYDR